MSALIYIHGFLSSPSSFKAQQVKRWVAQHHPSLAFHCPYLSPYPEEVISSLTSLLEKLLPGPVGLIGSSMGGFWATYLVERYKTPKAVLINPAVRPYELMQQYLDVELKNYHTDDTYRLNHHHMQQLKAADTSAITQHQRYWLMAQTGDEVLDYRRAVEAYQGCKQTVEPGGDHAFQNFEQQLPDVMAFLLR